MALCLNLTLLNLEYIPNSKKSQEVGCLRVVAFVRIVQVGMITQELLAEIKQTVKTNHPRASQTVIDDAYRLMVAKLAGVKRGDLDYVIHPLETALTVARLKLDPFTVAVALLHDLPYRGGMNIADLSAQFGRQAGELLQTMQDLRGIERRFSPEKRYLESARRMFIAVAKDFRSLLIKFAERLSNMQHLNTFPEEKQQRMVEVTEAIYIPLAGILGIWHLRWQLEDACFFWRQPVIAGRIKKKVCKAKQRISDDIVSDVQRQVLQRARQLGIHCQVQYRLKHTASIYRKLQEKKVRFHELYDIFALRLVTDTPDNCYRLLGVVHSLWRPVSGRVKDYIAQPKPNGYQSLHTAVFHGGRHAMEFQIRTQAMHDDATYGVSAHWHYKQTGSSNRRAQEQWIERLMTMRKAFEQSSQRGQLPIDALTNTIFCYTPKGDIIELPERSTVIDFAYAVHTELGHACRGALVNSLNRPVQARLRSNDVVEIIKGEQPHPRKTWLEFARTDRARHEIKRYFDSPLQAG